MDKLVGAIFPVPIDLIQRLFSGSSKVFVKYIPHNSTRLCKGNKIIVYESRGAKCLIGEGLISSIEFLTPDEVLVKYRESLFLDEEQLKAYVKLWPNRDPFKKMLTMKLIKLKKYDLPIKYANSITMTGRYVNSKEYQKIFQSKN
ncbi:MAG: DUF365 domain-containing protein [Candidatus Bathyarchaeota archaeon]|nr:DUF365 domain-containing protein [Candidatus Bathyarchaeota archaeon]